MAQDGGGHREQRALFGLTLSDSNLLEMSVSKVR
jgi:hypothetical protein